MLEDERRRGAGQSPRLWRSALEESAEHEGPRPLLTLIAELDALAAELAVADPTQLAGHAAAEAVVHTHRALDRIRAVQLGWLGRVEGDGAWVGTGAKSIGAWVARALDVTFHEARELVRTARAWRDVLPTTAAAVRAGEISIGKGALIAATATSPDRIETLTSPLAEDPASADPAHDSVGTADADTGESFLLGLARQHGVNEFRKLARHFSHVADPEADERGYREAIAREHFDMAATTGGYHLSGFLTTDHGQVIKTALRAVSGVPARDDVRTPGQRRAAALTNLGQLVLDKGLTGKVGTVRPHVSVHLSLTELEHVLRRTQRDHAPTEGDCPTPGMAAAEGATAGLAAPTGSRARLRQLVSSPPAEWEDGSSPIPRSVLRRLAADCEVTRIVFGPDSQVLDVGRAQRTFGGHLRRAVIARDRTCVVDDCGAPSSIGQVHHATVRWADGGRTAVPDGALVCGFHNQWLEDYRVPMRWRPGPDGRGRWQLGTPGSYRPDGSGHFPQDDPDHPDYVPIIDTS